ncbi:unnamed protein product, partial [Ectocarpus sp. 8 AP-2014]
RRGNKDVLLVTDFHPLGPTKKKTKKLNQQQASRSILPDTCPRKLSPYSANHKPLCRPVVWRKPRWLSCCLHGATLSNLSCLLGTTKSCEKDLKLTTRPARMPRTGSKQVCRENHDKTYGHNKTYGLWSNTHTKRGWV